MKIKYYGYLMLTIFLFSAAGIPVAYVLGKGLSTLQLVFFVEVSGTLLSGLFVILKRTHSKVKEYFLHKGQFAAVASVGILAFGLESLLLSYSAHFITASLIAVIYRAWPLILVLMAPFILHERITKLEAAGVVVGFSAMAITMLKGTAISIPATALPFVGVVLIAAVLDAITSAIMKRYQYELSSSLFMYNLTSLLIVAPLAIAFKAISFAGMNIDGIIAILFLGLVQNVIMSYAFTASLRSINTAIASNAYMLVPFITIVLGYVILNEPIKAYYLVIAFGVLAGILIQKGAKKESNYIPVKSKQKMAGGVIYDVSSAFINTKSPVIYEAFKGSARVLALKLHGEYALNGLEDINKVNEKYGDCIVFTEDHEFAKKHISPEEMEFVKEIVGKGPGEALVFGIGRPERVEAAFDEISSRLAAK